MAQEKICGIYCIENIKNGKKYIGLSKNIRKRWYEHRTKLNTDRHENIHLQRSFDKYGFDCFSFYVLEECCQECLSNMEKYYIEKYRTFDFNYGYNLTSGGDSNFSRSEESKEKFSISRSKRVLKIDLEGNILDSFRNASEAQKSLNESSKSKNIEKCCNKKYGRKTAGGFIWMHEEDYLENGIDLEYYNKKDRGKAIVMLSKDGLFIREYDSAREASKDGFNYKNISQVCRGERKTHKGYIWKFKDS